MQNSPLEPHSELRTKEQALRICDQILGDQSQLIRRDGVDVLEMSRMMARVGTTEQRLILYNLRYEDNWAAVFTVETIGNEASGWVLYMFDADNKCSVYQPSQPVDSVELLLLNLLQ